MENIKNYDSYNNEMRKSLEDKLEELKKTTQIPVTYDKDWVNEYVMDTNSRVVTDSIFKYETPIGVSPIYD